MRRLRFHVSRVIVAMMRLMPRLGRQDFPDGSLVRSVALGGRTFAMVKEAPPRRDPPSWHRSIFFEEGRT
jgi:hypothetical protein